jgi:hypothetical protein
MVVRGKTLQTERVMTNIDDEVVTCGKSDCLIGTSIVEVICLTSERCLKRET